MVYNYNKQQILTALQCGQPQIIEELKRIMIDLVSNGDIIIITKQIDSYPIEDLEALGTLNDVNNFYMQFGF